MGEYADLFINGLVDAETGQIIDGDAPGHPRTRWRAAHDTQCRKCGKLLRGQQGPVDHMLAKHTMGQSR